MIGETHVSARRIFEPNPDQVATARHFARAVSADWGLDPSEIEIVVGELAANAVLHGRTPFTVSLAARDARLRLEVADDNPRTPLLGPGLVSAQSGRGLRVVEALATEWGVDLVPDNGKVIWAEFELDRMQVSA